jgi:hypothetical protein
MIRSGAFGVRPSIMPNGECSEGVQGCARTACSQKKGIKQTFCGRELPDMSEGAQHVAKVCHTVPLKSGTQRMTHRCRVVQKSKAEKLTQSTAFGNPADFTSTASRPCVSIAFVVLNTFRRSPRCLCGDSHVLTSAPSKAGMR